jgi:hypothetical protein
MPLAILGAAAWGPTAGADEPAKRSDEQKVLDRFVGTWDVKVTAKLPGQEPTSHNTTETRKLSRGGGVLVFENPEPPEFHMLISYDPKAEKYIGMWMAGAERGQLTGTWDEKTTSMKFETTGPEGSNSTSTYRFFDRDHSESSAVFRDSAGKVLSEVTWKHTRKR